MLAAARSCWPCRFLPCNKEKNRKAKKRQGGTAYANAPAVSPSRSNLPGLPLPLRFAPGRSQVICHHSKIGRYAPKSLTRAAWSPRPIKPPVPACPWHPIKKSVCQGQAGTGGCPLRPVPSAQLKSGSAGDGPERAAGKQLAGPTHPTGHFHPVPLMREADPAASGTAAICRIRPAVPGRSGQCRALVPSLTGPTGDRLHPGFLRQELVLLPGLILVRRQRSRSAPSRGPYPGRDRPRPLAAACLVLLLFQLVNTTAFLPVAVIRS